MEPNLEEVEENVSKSELVYDAEVRSCRCTELEERSKKAEARCVELELEVRCRKSECEVLDSKCRTLEVAKLALEDEIKVLKSQNNQFKDLISHGANENVIGGGGKGMLEGTVDLAEETHEEDNVFQLLAENRVLECEKSKAENEAEVWKQKLRELESSTLLPQKGLVLKSAQKPFDEQSSEANCYRAVCQNKPSEAMESNDRSQFETTLENFPAIDKGVGLVDSGSNLISPSKCTGNLQPAGTPYNDTPYKHFTSDEGDYSREPSNKRVRRNLAFQDERSLTKQMAPSTPSGAKPASVGIIDIHDSDDEPHLAPSAIKPEIRKGNIPPNYELERAVGSESETKIFYDQNQEEEVDFVNTVSLVSVPKRKRPSNMVTSDTESDDDDNVPIGKLWRMRFMQMVPGQTNTGSKSCKVAATPPGIDDIRSTVTPRKRRLVSLRRSEQKTVVKNCSSKRTSKNECKSIPTTEDVDHVDLEEIGSDSESDSLKDFIVDDSDIADGDNYCSESTGGSERNNNCSGLDAVSSGSNACSVSEDVSDDEVNMDMILSQLRRNKDEKSDWKFEGELLAAFGKDVELCMKAVCALYRQQSAGEKLHKATFLRNHRGFSQCDAWRGCSLGEFLVGGDPQSDLKKSVEELKKHDPNAVEVCRDLATRYSKQLFEIYNNKEDPYFRSS